MKSTFSPPEAHSPVRLGEGLSQIGVRTPEGVWVLCRLKRSVRVPAVFRGCTTEASALS